MIPYTQSHATAPTLSGVITGMPESVYHARPEISKHDADLAWRAPVLLRDKLKTPHKPTPAMIDGTILGALILGLPIDDIAVILPDNAPRKPSSSQINAKKPSDETIAAIQWWGSFSERIGTRHVITEPELQEYHRVVDAVRANPECAKLLSHEIASEVSMFWECPLTGLQRRGRPDRIREGGIVIDLKKTAEADPASFQRAVVNYRYDVQAAEYVDAWKILTGEDIRFYWLCYETEAPYLTACYEASPTLLECGRRRRDKALEKVKACIDSGTWGGYQTGFPLLEPPKWLAIEEGVA